MNGSKSSPRVGLSSSGRLVPGIRAGAASVSREVSSVHDEAEVDVDVEDYFDVEVEVDLDVEADFGVEVEDVAGNRGRRLSRTPPPPPLLLRQPR